MTDLTPHARSAAVRNPRLDIFTVPPTDLSISARKEVRINPLTTGINPINFNVDPSRDFINLDNTFFEVELEIKKADGTNIVAATRLQLANNLAHTLNFTEHTLNFINYYCQYFEDDAEMFWFPKFKQLAREIFKLMDPSDLDHEPVKRICHPQTEDTYGMAMICYHHNETYFMEEIMDWVELAQTGKRLKGIAPKGKDIHFLRNRAYYMQEQ